MTTTERDFVKTFNELAKIVSKISEAKGWTIKNDLPNKAMKIALIHSELS